MMYVPPLDCLLKSIGCDRNNFESSEKLYVPAPLLRLLLQIAVVQSDFNEEGYLKANPDILEAVRQKSIESASLHYVGFGYFEGRLGATPDVDEAWYLKTYPDVSQAVATGDIASAQEHFNIVGAAEGRSPNAAYLAEAFQWKKALVSARIARPDRPAFDGC